MPKRPARKKFQVLVRIAHQTKKVAVFAVKGYAKFAQRMRFLI